MADEMTSDRLADALRACHGMLLAYTQAGRVVHHARVFAESAASPAVLIQLHKPLEMEAFLDLHRQVQPNPMAASCKLLNPTKEVVLGNAVWITREIRGFPRFKACRWVGFAAGSLDFHHLMRGLRGITKVDGGDLPMVLRCAENPKATYHPIAHLTLGFMQGWLWAAGSCDINEFRRMNMPDGAPFVPKP